MRIRRHHAEDRFHEAAHGLHGFAEFVVGFGVNLRVARNLAVRFAVIVHTPEIIAIWHRRKGSIDWKNFQSVTRKVEIADDFRTQQRNYVRADGKLKSRKNFFSDGSAA